jgi:hypothetical protein
MATMRLPDRLPDWEGAERIAAQIDPVSLRMTVGQLVDLVLSEDVVFLDSLDDILESAIVVPLTILAGIYDDKRPLVELVVAARLVRRSVESYLEDAPQELVDLIYALPE